MQNLIMRYTGFAMDGAGRFSPVVDYIEPRFLRRNFATMIGCAEYGRRVAARFRRMYGTGVGEIVICEVDNEYNG